MRARDSHENAVELPDELDAKLKAFFDKMDADKNGEVSKAVDVEGCPSDPFWAEPGNGWGLKTVDC